MQITKPFHQDFKESLFTVLQGKPKTKDLNKFDTLLQRIFLEIKDNPFTLQITLVFKKFIKNLSEFYTASHLIRSQTFRSLEKLLNNRVSLMNSPSFYPEGILEVQFNECIIYARLHTPSTAPKGLIPNFYIIHETLFKFHTILPYHTKTEILLLETHIQNLVFEKLRILYKTLRKPFPSSLKGLKIHVLTEIQLEKSRTEADALLLEILTNLFFQNPPAIYNLATLAKIQTLRQRRVEKLIPKLSAINFILEKTYQSWQIFQSRPDFPFEYFKKSIQRLTLLYKKAKAPPPEKLVEMQQTIESI
jgi:hypothetical protein